MSDTTGSSAAGPRVRLAAEDVSVRHGHVVAVDGVSLSLGAGEVMGLVGPNGSGKTSLLRAMAGLRPPSSGRCVLDGDDIGALRARERARRVAYVGQDEHSELPFTAREVMTLGRSQHGSAWSGYDRRDHDEVERVVDLLGLRRLADRPLAHMSGGERQRVLVGRGLVQAAGQPDPLMLLDEPTNHLDPRFQQTVLHTVVAEVGTAVVVLHDLDLAAAFCDRVALMDEGRLVAVGAPHAVLTARTLADLYRTRARVMRLPDRVHVVLGR